MEIVKMIYLLDGSVTETVKILLAGTYSGLLQCCWCTSGFLICSNNHNSLKPSSLFRSFQLILRLQPRDMTKDTARPINEITWSFKLSIFSNCDERKRAKRRHWSVTWRNSSDDLLKEINRPGVSIIMFQSMQQGNVVLKDITQNQINDQSQSKPS